MDDRKKLSDNFHEAMLDLYRRALGECKYDGKIFYVMLKKYRGEETAKRLLRRNAGSYGFEKLFYDKKRPDLTVEYLVLQPPWSDLFLPEQLNVARERLGGSSG